MAIKYKARMYVALINCNDNIPVKCRVASVNKKGTEVRTPDGEVIHFDTHGYPAGPHTGYGMFLTPWTKHQESRAASMRDVAQVKWLTKCIVEYVRDNPFNAKDVVDALSVLRNRHCGG